MVFVQLRSRVDDWYHQKKVGVYIKGECHHERRRRINVTKVYLRYGQGKPMEQWEVDIGGF